MADRFISENDIIENIDNWLENVGVAYVGKGLSYYGELLGCIQDANTVWECLGAYEAENGRMYLDLDGIRLVIADGKIEGWYIP